MLAKYT